MSHPSPPGPATARTGAVPVPKARRTAAVRAAIATSRPGSTLSRQSDLKKTSASKLKASLSGISRGSFRNTARISGRGRCWTGSTTSANSSPRWGRRYMWTMTPVRAPTYSRQVCGSDMEGIIAKLARDRTRLKSDLGEDQEPAVQPSGRARRLLRWTGLPMSA